MPLKSVWVPSSDGSGMVNIFSRNQDVLRPPLTSLCPCRGVEARSRSSVCSSANNWCYPPPYRRTGAERYPCKATSSFHFSGMDWKLRQQRQIEEANQRHRNDLEARTIREPHYFGRNSLKQVLSDRSQRLGTPDLNIAHCTNNTNENNSTRVKGRRQSRCNSLEKRSRKSRGRKSSGAKSERADFHKASLDDPICVKDGKTGRCLKSPRDYNECQRDKGLYQYLDKAERKHDKNRIKKSRKENCKINYKGFYNENNNANNDNNVNFKSKSDLISEFQYSQTESEDWSDYDDVNEDAEENNDDEENLSTEDATGSYYEASNHSSYQDLSGSRNADDGEEEEVESPKKTEKKEEDDKDEITKAEEELKEELKEEEEEDEGPEGPKEARDAFQPGFTRYFKIIRSNIPLGGPAIFMQLSRTAVYETD